jgi:hypothetical protein
MAVDVWTRTREQTKGKRSMRNERSNRTFSQRCESARRTALFLCMIALAGCSPKSTIASRPIPKGHAWIHVEFKGLSTGQFNKLTEFVARLAESHSALVKGAGGERNAYHGFWNNGFVDQIYKAEHPLPSPQVEASMKAGLESFCQSNGIDGRALKFERSGAPPPTK